MLKQETDLLILLNKKSYSGSSKKSPQSSLKVHDSTNNSYKSQYDNLKESKENFVFSSFLCNEDEDWVQLDKEKQPVGQPKSSQETKENVHEKFLNSSRNDQDRGKKCKTSPSKKICDNSGVGKVAHAGISKRSYSESSKKSLDLNKTVPDSTNTNENKSVTIF